MSGYARGELDYNILPVTHESVEEDEEEPEDYDSERCSQDQYTCKNLQCIKVDQRCDGTRHCSDGSDEVNCTLIKPGD